MTTKQIENLRVLLDILLSALHGESFKGGDLKGTNVAQWCKSASRHEILNMAESYSLLDS